ncbi:MAG: hypothetical protein ACOCYZ_03615, partial [Halococcoides sp.]
MATHAVSKPVVIAPVSSIEITRQRFVRPADSTIDDRTGHRDGFDVRTDALENQASLGTSSMAIRVV